MKEESPTTVLEKNREIFKNRASLLARPLEKERGSRSFLELLVFKLAQEEYALETQHIREVYPLKNRTILPGTPSFIYGLVNLRRKIIAIVDLKPFFGLQNDPKADPKIILLEDREREFALLTDGIVGIQKVNIDDIQVPPPTLTGIRQEFLKGISTEGIVILDGQKLLSSKHLVVDEAVDLTS